MATPKSKCGGRLERGVKSKPQINAESMIQNVIGVCLIPIGV